MKETISLQSNDTKELVIKLSTEGHSSRSIENITGISKSTINYFLSRETWKEWWDERDSLADYGWVGVGSPPNLNKVVKSNKKGRTHLIIADTQVKPNQDLGHIKALGKYINELRPEVIVCIGDWWDMESLSSYDKGKLSFEGRRVKADLDAGNDAMKLLVGQFKCGDYSPEMVFTVGNHEFRCTRFVQNNLEFEGFIGENLLNLEQYGWEVYEFLQPCEVDGITYVHYLANPFTGRPYGGSALNQLKNVGCSFVVGHKQTLDIAIRPTLNGKMQLGIINGAYYKHNEDYKGHQGNNHFRGVTVLHDVEDGFGDPMVMSLDAIVRDYGEE